MAKLTSKVIAAVKNSELGEGELVAAIEAARKPQPSRRRRTYNRRDMQAQSATED